MRELPLNGELSRAKNKRYQETIVFVHFWGGTKEHLKRHVRLVNEIGFDAVSFNLSFNKRWAIPRVPWSTRGEFGLKHIWADEVEWILNSIAGPKIIYAFSNPTSCAIEATIRRSTSDIKAIIGDSGPFVDFAVCNVGLLNVEYKIPKLLAYASAEPFRAIWGWSHDQEVRNHIGLLPDGFPFLSIRCGKDLLVPVSAIAHAFEQANQLKLEVLMLPDSGHLTGLRDFGPIYRPTVEKFLSSIGTRNEDVAVSEQRTP